MPIFVRGIEPTKLAFRVGMMKLHVLKTDAMMKFGEELKVVAQEELDATKYVDTGALKSSIHVKLVESNLENIRVDVVAGDPSVIRGGGSFKVSTKYPDNLVEPIPTTEYAAKVELEGGKRGPAYYMRTAFEYGKQIAPLRVNELLIKAVKGI